ncbi:hypothetical protein GG804_14175 [Sphingomonas histidinilytica]|uniref:hypothetical protein n=1 Tax=Rhizorhabdus histidinilytica TaxID=439228 RepID=UPI001ADA4823|nr:hypothetical protein [Rhizorhabdus histidinilytica]MBO9377917.1 hypothetical protein [Rhizorhabdus histidinilytica]
MKVIILAAIVAITSPAVAADQFDLVCTSKKTSERYRVDLARNEFCFGECEQVMPIAEVTSGMIVLRKTDPSPPENSTIYNQINRITGEWEWYNYSPRLSITAQDIRGHCEPAEFSGFPAAKF